MIRGGAAYYGSPYKDETLKASRVVLSGGIGYRTNRNFIDFTIVSSTTKDAIFPYRFLIRETMLTRPRSEKNAGRGCSLPPFGLVRISWSASDSAAIHAKPAALAPKQ